MEMEFENLLSKRWIQTSSLVVEANARYSALTEDRETADCFLERHDIKKSPRKTQYHVTDLRVSKMKPQSESEKALT